MNGNGQVVVAGLFLVTSMAVAMFAVGLFEVPTSELEAKPIQLLQIESDEALFSRAPIELLEVEAGEVFLNLAPYELLEGEAGAALFNLAPIELLLQSTDGAERGLTPEQIYHGISVQAFAQARAVTAAKGIAHTGACSGRY